jgi:hypothetical protein
MLPAANHGSTDVKSWDFIRQLFRPEDPVAIVLINKDTGATKQRVVSAQQAASPEYQAYLRGKNFEGYNVLLGMNPLRAKYAVRLPMPVNGFDKLRSKLSSLPDIGQWSDNAELKWNFAFSDSQNRARQAAQKIEDCLREQGLEGFTVNLKASANPIGHVLRLTLTSADDLNTVKSSLAALPNLENYAEERYRVWLFPAATIADGQRQAERAGKQIDDHLRDVDGRTKVYQLHHRLKEDVREVRRLYLDLDSDGLQKLKRIHDDAMADKLPVPNYITMTSPDRYQVLWTIEPGLTHEKAEQALRVLAREYGGDPACCDVSRVLRIPRFHNKKYEQYTPTKAECWSRSEHPLSAFACISGLAAKHTAEDAERLLQGTHRVRSAELRRAAGDPSSNSQSHRDWHYCCREAERTIFRSRENEVHSNLEKTYALLRTHLANHCSEKHGNPAEYARFTIDALRKHISEKIPSLLQKRRADSGLDEADRKIVEITGRTISSCPAERGSGHYSGSFIGETPRYYLQQLNLQTVVAHRKEDFSTLFKPQCGERYAINYSNYSATAKTESRHLRQESSKAR